MTPTYEIVKYRPEFRADMIHLAQSHWGTTWNAEYFTWKYENNPYMSSPCVFLAVSDGKVVGNRGMYGAKWQVGDPPQTFVGPCAGDVIIAPDHRNRGVFAKMTAAALDDLDEQGYEYAFNLSAGEITYVSSLAMGWRSIGSLQLLRRNAKRRPIASRARRAFDLVTAGRWSDKTGTFDALDQYQDDPNNTLLAIEQRPRCEAMAQFHRQRGLDERIRHVRDAEYFAWRFRNPRSRYRFLYWGGEQLEGYLILGSPKHWGQRRVCILDWEGSSPGVRNELLRAVVKRGRFRDIRVWSATLSDETQALLSTHGFKQPRREGSLSHSRPTVLVSPVRRQQRPAEWQMYQYHLLDMANWDLPAASSDYY